jgi:hypothetical protein
MEKEVIVDGKVINLEVHYSQFRYGTRQDSRNLEVWVVPSIEEPIVVY